MGYDKKVYEEADRIIQERRNTALKNSDEKKEEFLKKYPEAGQLEKKLSFTMTKLIRLMLSNKTELHTALEELKEENLSIQNQLNEVYKKAGINEKELKPKYHCFKCEDKGNIDGKMCSCYKQLVKEIACENLNKLSPFQLSTFETFSLKYYSDKPTEENKSEREIMERTLNYCKNYVSKIETLQRNNILMIGNTGLGKTHLSLAIAREATEKGIGVIYCSTPEILSKLEKEHFNKGYNISEESSEDILKECDLLILDDLGSEFPTSFTKSKIYNIISFRSTYNKPTIISTNLKMPELEEMYSKRLISRFFSDYVNMKFVGSDIRQKKRLEKYHK